MARRSSWLLLIASSLAAVACTAAPGGAAASIASPDTTAQPTLAFDADWTVTQTGSLTPGAIETLHYDLARLPRCRATTDSVQAWAITAYYAVDGGPVHTLLLPTTTAASVDVPFETPFGHDLAFWFLNSDDSGCSDWDSNFGRNFHFSIAAPASPVVHFRADWSMSIDGTPRAGQDLVVDYDLDRLPSCRQTYNELDTWQVQVDYRIDGGPVQNAPLTTVVGTQRFQAPATIAVPAGAHAVTMWFENYDRTGCQTWDSSYGQNFVIAVQ